jgi:hypothetical protein
MDVTAKGWGATVKNASTDAHENCKKLAETVCEGAEFKEVVSIADDGMVTHAGTAGVHQVTRTEKWECPKKKSAEKSE